MLAGDAQAVAATFTVDGYELPPHHPAVKRRAAIQQRYETFFKGPRQDDGVRIGEAEAVDFDCRHVAVPEAARRRIGGFSTGHQRTDISGASPSQKP